jgi:hypothetical protein
VVFDYLAIKFKDRAIVLVVLEFLQHILESEMPALLSVLKGRGVVS